MKKFISIARNVCIVLFLASIIGYALYGAAIVHGVVSGVIRILLVLFVVWALEKLK